MSNETETRAAVGCKELLGHGVQTEGYPKGWMRVVLMVSPDGKDAHAIGGDCALGDGDTLYYGYEHVRRWLQAYNAPKKPPKKLPWWKRDRLGWPIATFKGKPVKSALRIICQNIRKIIG